MESFMFYVFFPLHMYNSNTNSLIIVGAHLIFLGGRGGEGYYAQFVSLIDLIHSL